ncbi:HD-GYP domain-containing protein [Desulfovibrio sp. TomC]|uniref:HD-GYP domain-containing protein n=1 Tax=Desulfovibrio sp. TomC TaxID=1562888 RepID=UPI00064D02CA|nr:HD-GYP domain-containing protein [Desulfovibrio sp. TomC]
MPPSLLLAVPGVFEVLTAPAGPDQDALMALVHELAASLGKAIDAKDPHTLAHSEEVAEVANYLATVMGLPREATACIHVAGHLHDIGKIGVPDAVLGKPGRLNPNEWEKMKAHPVIGAEILLPLTCFAQTGIVAMVKAHHERFDGGGYPQGLCGQAIPLGARIICVADSLSAMLQTRPYRPAMGFDEALREIVRCSGSQFDPEVVAAFTAVAGDVRRLFGSCRDGIRMP